VSQSPARAGRRKGAGRRSKIPADASVFVAVNVPSVRYEANVKRVMTVLDQAGYDAHAMTGEFILKMAADIQAELAAADEAARLIDHAASQRKDPE
jgi:hypothetical protein